MNVPISRRSMVAWTGASRFLFATACVSRPPPPADIVAGLAPTGRLRASINFGHPILARRDPVKGEAEGVSVDPARALAEHPNTWASASCC